MNIPSPFKTAARTALLGALALGLFGTIAAFAQDARRPRRAAPPRSVDKGNTAWMLTSTAWCC